MSRFYRIVRRYPVLSGLAVLGVALPTLWGCGGNQSPVLVENTVAVAYADSDSLFPRIRFGDDQVSLNDRCPVRLAKLNLRLPPIYVNGRPVGFC